MVLLNGMLYATPTARTNFSLWQINAKTVGAPIQVASGMAGISRCVAASRIFWRSYDAATAKNLIVSCPLAACNPATPTNWAGGVESWISPECDPATGELVWIEEILQADADSPRPFKIWRANPDGTNKRQMSSFSVPAHSGGGASLRASERPDRLFFSVQQDGIPTISHYYIDTRLMNAGAVPIVSASFPSSASFPAGLDHAVANDTLLLFGGGPTYGAPLPNGLKAGDLPSTVYSSYILSGVMDASSFYGSLVGTASDVISKCPAGDCSNPSILFRGQTYPGSFVQDATAIYWSTFGTGADAVIWKAAK